MYSTNCNLQFWHAKSSTKYFHIFFKALKKSHLVPSLGLNPECLMFNLGRSRTTIFLFIYTRSFWALHIQIHISSITFAFQMSCFRGLAFLELARPSDLEGAWSPQTMWIPHLMSIPKPNHFDPFPPNHSSQLELKDNKWTVTAFSALTVRAFIPQALTPPLYSFRHNHISPKMTHADTHTDTRKHAHTHQARIHVRTHAHTHTHIQKHTI